MFELIEPGRTYKLGRPESLPYPIANVLSRYPYIYLDRARPGDTSWLPYGRSYRLEIHGQGRMFDYQNYSPCIELGYIYVSDNHIVFAGFQCGEYDMGILEVARDAMIEGRNGVDIADLIEPVLPQPFAQAMFIAMIRLEARYLW